VVLLEGVQHLFQLQQNWLLYRSTAEELRRERFLYRSRSGRYAGEDRERVLADRLVTGAEHGRWASLQHSAGGRGEAAR
jgi:hypothetical protein